MTAIVPHFIGDVDTRWLVETGAADRRMLLLSTVSFMDSTGYLWTAHPGEIVDGASIPDALWPIAGTPLIGDYRRASVVHDVACQRLERTSRDAARMFWEAMVADGFDPLKAHLFYLAVRYKGPQWDEAGPIVVPQHLSLDAHEAALDQALISVPPPGLGMVQ